MVGISSPSGAPASPISKGDTQDAIKIFSALATSDDPETLRSVGEGLAKVARKGWQSEIDIENGVEICMQLIKHESPRVYTKGLALLTPLSANERCRPGLIALGAVEVAWAFSTNPACESKADYLAECWKESLQSLCNFACGDDDCVAAVVNAGGIPSLVDNINTQLQPLVVAAVQNLSRNSSNHQEILGTPALSKLVAVLSDDASGCELRASAAAALANLAENTECHQEIQFAGVAAVLLRTTSDESEALRRELARGLANLCVVLDNQRNILIHKYLWNTYAVLAMSTLPADQEVATTFYLYISENESLAEILQYTEVPVAEHLIYPLVALGYQEACCDRAAVAFGNLAPTLRAVVAQEDDAIQMLAAWLEDGTPICINEAIRVFNTLTSLGDQISNNVLYLAVKCGVVASLASIATHSENIVVQCSAVKLLSMICKRPELHCGAIEGGVLDQLLALASQDDFVAKAEAVNSLGNVFQNPAVHPSLVSSGGLIVALEMAQSPEALLSSRGVQLLTTLCNSTAAHVPMVNAGCLALFDRLAHESSEEIRGVIAGGFSALATNEDCCKVMCKDDHVKVLGTMAENREHLLSSGSLRLLMAMAERFHQNGASAFATRALADLAGSEACCAEMLENDGFARLSVLAGCTDANIRRETSRLLAHFMDHATTADE